MTGSRENHESVLQDLSGKAALHRLAELAGEFGAEHIEATARSVAERVSEGLFYVACVGQFKRGKSTLLNALIGAVILPTGVVPVTTVPSIIRYGKSLGARVRFDNADWTDTPVSAIEEYVSEEKNPENAKRVTGLEIFVPNPLLEAGMCLVDTPGLGSVFVANTAATHAFIPHIDAAIVVIGADPPLSGDELQLVEIVAKQAHDLLFVLNKADRASEVERTAALEFARNVLGKRLNRDVSKVFEVSALERLEGQGPSRDWSELVQALNELVVHSGRSLVREATERGICRASNQLLAVIKEEREALQRPFEESEQRIAKLRETLESGERTLRDLGVLFTAEQQRLSETFAERRKAFLRRAQRDARMELNERLHSLAQTRNGRAYRLEVNHLAQRIVHARLTPWLDGEATYAEEAFRKAARRFVELGNDFLRSLGETGVDGLEELPQELGGHGLHARSQFHFHVIEREAAPASPFLLISDLVLGVLGLRKGIIRNAERFVDQLVEVNSSRVQYDVDERVREGRRKLEVEIRGLLREALAIADRALARARATQAAGGPAVEAAIARLDALDREVMRLSTQVALL